MWRFFSTLLGFFPFYLGKNAAFGRLLDFLPGPGMTFKAYYCWLDRGFLALIPMLLRLFANAMQ